MSARVVFADGSKQLAHNNEDLFERWRLRREAMPSFEREREPERDLDTFLPSLPDAIEDADIDAAYTGLHQKRSLIETRLTRVKAELREMGPWATGSQALRLEHTELSVARERVFSQIQTMKPMRKAAHRRRSEVEDQARRDQPATIAGLRALLEQRKANDHALYDYLEHLIERFGDVEALDSIHEEGTL